MTDNQALTGTVAVLGAGGIMGFPIARNIARAGFPLRAWNRTREKASPLEGDGAHVADTPAQAAGGASVVITMLADEDAVRSAMEGPDGALPAMSGQESGPRGDDPDSAAHALWVQMGTIGEEATKRCAELANRHGVGFVDAPVLGTKQPAEQGSLVILESGPEEARPRIDPVFDAIGYRTLHVGEAGAGSRLKLVLNNWVLAVVAAGAETIALAEGLGLDPDLIFKALEGGALDLPYLRMKGKAMTERDFSPVFSLQLAAKDAMLVRAAARQRGLDLPVADAVADRLAAGAKEYPDLDMSATYLTSVP
jgi:3-hydroxyisobutyrate dehydrogenase